MRKKMYPQFTIQNIKEINDTIVVIGNLDRTRQGKEKWIDDGWIGTLKKGSIIAFGRWHKKANNAWQFTFDEEDKNKLQLTPNEVIEAIDGYWGERAEITLDDSIEWVETIFVAKGNWDHEHCAICWESIYENENNKYYLGNNRYPVCLKCYNLHIKPCDISFIPST